MGVRQALAMALAGWRAGLGVSKVETSVPVNGGQFTAPRPADIPTRWADALMGPGIPLPPVLSNQRSRVAELEPRSFQYVPNVNATISPRIAYGLLPFGILKNYAEAVPEVAMCVRILTEELKTFTPRIVGPDGNLAEIDALRWMTTRPDGYTPWPVWLSRYLYNVLAYDAASLYKIRADDNKIIGLRILDGSTIFVLIDERGEQPAPPAPAFTQIIFGMPRIWLSTNQLWYQPRHMRADAPYGRTPVEDALSSVQLLSNLWAYETAWYTEGTMPESFVTAPVGWTPEQVLAWERGFNERMSGNTAERRRLRVIPNGFTLATPKSADWRKDTYDTALERVSFSFGVPPSELGKAPGGGLGGKGYSDKQESAFYRMGIGPLKGYLEAPFNDALQDNGYTGYRFELSFGSGEIDLERRRSQGLEAWTSGLSPRDESRQYIGLNPVGGPAGAAYLMPAGKADTALTGGQPGQAGQAEAGQPGANHNGNHNGHGPDSSTPTSLIEDTETPEAPGSAVPEAGDSVSKGYVPAVGDTTGLAGLNLPACQCPYNGCKCLLEVSRPGFYRCGKCGRIFYAETAKDDYKWYTAVRYHEAITRHGRPPADETLVTAKELRPWEKFLYLTGEILKHCGVCEEDDAYYGAPVSQDKPVYFPVQGANDTQIVALSPGGLESRPAIWKPASGENPTLTDFVGGPMYPREEGAYLIDRTLEFYLVPVAYTAEVDGQIGAVMHYVRGADPRHDLSGYSPLWLERAAVLDYLICQLDRKAHNWLTHPDDPSRPILIDNGLSQPVNYLPFSSAFCNYWAGKEISQDSSNAVLTVKNNFHLWNDLASCIGAEATAGVKWRVDNLLETGKIPTVAEYIDSLAAAGLWREPVAG